MKTIVDIAIMCLKAMPKSFYLYHDTDATYVVLLPPLDDIITGLLHTGEYH